MKPLLMCVLLIGEALSKAKVVRHPFTTGSALMLCCSEWLDLQTGLCKLRSRYAQALLQDIPRCAACGDWSVLCRVMGGKEKLPTVFAAAIHPVTLAIMANLGSQQMSGPSAKLLSQVMHWKEGGWCAQHVVQA